MSEIKGTSQNYSISQYDCFWNMLCMTDENIQKLNPTDIQNKCGIYLFYNNRDNIIRIGKAVKLRNRIMSYARDGSNWYIFKDMQREINYVGVIYVDNQSSASFIEMDLINHYKPKYNIHGI